MMKIQSTTVEATKKSLDICTEAFASLDRRADLGFLRLPSEKNAVAAVQEVVQKFQNFQELVIVGIGGSSLGAQVIEEVFRDHSSKKVLFCDNVDPFEFDRLWKSLKDPKQTAWAFVSKSGSTIETMVSLEFILERLKDLSAPWKNQIAVISEKRENPLFNFAQRNSLPLLEIPVDVGGRFSVLTAVGLLPAAFLGVDIQRILGGAARALESKNLIVNMSALTLDSFLRGQWVTTLWNYSSHLKKMGLWTQQLWAESLAKKLNRQFKSAPRVSTPIPAMGAMDQHSILQQLMEGAPDKWIVFTRVLALEEKVQPLNNNFLPEMKSFVGKSMGQLLMAEAQGTTQALSSAGVSSVTLELTDLGPESMGFCFMFWQLVIGCLGEALDIDAFNQPGVELGKRLAREILKV